MIKLVVMGHVFSEYTGLILQRLQEEGICPYYCILEEYDDQNLAETEAGIDLLQVSNVIEPQNYAVHVNNGICVGKWCLEHNIPFFPVDSQNGMLAKRLLTVRPADILLITEGPIISNKILELPGLFTMNIHPAPLPLFRGNWATKFGIYNDYPPLVSAHTVTNEIDGGDILGTLSYEIYPGDMEEEIERKAMMACVELAAVVLKNILAGEGKAYRQKRWQGSEYKGKMRDGVLQPAMPESIQRELHDKLKKQKYGFYSTKSKETQAEEGKDPSASAQKLL